MLTQLHHIREQEALRKEAWGLDQGFAAYETVGIYCGPTAITGRHQFYSVLSTSAGTKEEREIKYKERKAKADKKPLCYVVDNASRIVFPDSFTAGKYAGISTMAVVKEMSIKNGRFRLATEIERQFLIGKNCPVIEIDSQRIFQNASRAALANKCSIDIMESRLDSPRVTRYRRILR